MTDSFRPSSRLEAQLSEARDLLGFAGNAWDDGQWEKVRAAADLVRAQAELARIMLDVELAEEGRRR